MKAMKNVVLGEDFRIDKEENGEWKEAKVINDNYVVNAVGWIIKENGKFQDKIDWLNLYGKLSKGKYRLVKEVYSYGNKKEIFAEFTIK